MLRPPAIYLASASPRRQQLLQQLGVDFEVVATDVEERPRAGEDVRAYVMRLARAKALRAAVLIKQQSLPYRQILGADTEVALDGEILGKPLDRAQGLAMLRRLSGRTHQVLTAIALLHQDGLEEDLSESQVTFAPLSDADVERYWASGEPADKAGGYAVQGQAAGFIERIEGSYSGIVGLPLFELARLLKKF